MDKLWWLLIPPLTCWHPFLFLLLLTTGDGSDVGAEFELPIRLAPNAPLMLVPVTINGKGPFDFVLDTGATSTVVSRSLADELGLVQEEAPDSLGVAVTKSASTRLESLALGPARREGVQAGVIDFAGVNQCIGSKLGGSLGHDFLRDYVLTVDYPAGTLHFAPVGAPHSTPPRPAKAETDFDVTPVKPLIRVPVHINDRGPFRFVLDTGASASLVSEELAKSLGLPGSEDVSVQTCGVGSRPAARRVEVNSLAIGSGRIGNSQIVAGGLSLEAIGRAAGAELDGVIGYDYLKNFRVQINFGRRTLRLE